MKSSLSAFHEVTKQDLGKHEVCTVQRKSSESDYLQFYSIPQSKRIFPLNVRSIIEAE